MLYDITLKITYAYETAAESGRHQLCLMPADLPGEQRVIASSLTVDPSPTEQTWHTDFFGNSWADIGYDGAVKRTEFKVRSRIERFDPDELFDVSPDMDGIERQLDTLTSVQPLSPHHFRWTSERIHRHGPLAAWAAERTAGASSAYRIAETLSNALHEEWTFDSQATMVDTPIEEAFELKRGVCQDFAHLAISALRSLGIPAGYVSGYLRTIPPKGQARLEGADAMHAWIMAWCGTDMGWVELDPTNATRAGADHIVIARGRDYADVAPVRGALRTSGKQRTSQAVDVVEIAD
ncbi:transglutaminase family protein [Pelagovum pacificum]|uniref:Transglutaminase family protein n=1 Tax=Pelagovum pacificum TaxID=2588711 RepID=A0A5C5G8C0_9RHOB|nr:transglutaminase family protein [Pelagovum pacificum]QQA41692.1 transglutaminase family protein [Pelagovum pacificum]TNY30969.1 transglutaminase family protein [Pelagovum pacificum]